MRRIKLRSPVPRKVQSRILEFQYPITETSYLPTPKKIPRRDFFSVVEGRRSRREFHGVSRDLLSAFLWYSSKIIACRIESAQRRLEFRPAPSAGACHPHDLLIFEKNRQCSGVAVYNPRNHALMHLKCAPSDVQIFRSKVGRVLNVQNGTILWLGCQAQRTSSIYHFSESLLWRDAGSLMGVMAMVAEGLNLAFCPIGITGEPHLSALLQSRGHVVGFGGAILGG